jgi:sugar/nucleoside kinase (ribokinase family)
MINLVTPDGERTMRCLPGAGNDLTANDLHPNIFRTTKHVHFEGYALYNYELVESAMRMAKENGATISFDLASFEVVRRHKNFILHILKSYVDIVFVNQNEAFALTELPPEDAALLISTYCPIAIILVGEKGSYLSSKDTHLHIPAQNVDVLDTTGAGDLYAAGFLHGYLQRRSLEKCAEWGTGI